jgi:hypothetical protein
MPTPYTYLTCRELMSKYPSVKLWGWNVVKIGVYYNCLLLDGRKFGKNSQTIIIEKSFSELMTFVEQQVEIIDTNPTFMAYHEVLEEIPQTVLYRWNPNVIGFFRNSGLLQGKKSHQEGINMVTFESVLRLIEFTNQRFRDIARLSSG